MVHKIIISLVLTLSLLYCNAQSNFLFNQHSSDGLFSYSNYDNIQHLGSGECGGYGGMGINIVYFANNLASNIDSVIILGVTKVQGLFNFHINLNVVGNITTNFPLKYKVTNGNIQGVSGLWFAHTYVLGQDFCTVVGIENADIGYFTFRLKNTSGNWGEERRYTLKIYN